MLSRSEALLARLKIHATVDTQTGGPVIRTVGEHQKVVQKLETDLAQRNQALLDEERWLDAQRGEVLQLVHCSKEQRAAWRRALEEEMACQRADIESYQRFCQEVAGVPCDDLLQRKRLLGAIEDERRFANLCGECADERDARVLARTLGKGVREAMRIFHSLTLDARENDDGAQNDGNCDEDLARESIVLEVVSAELGRYREEWRVRLGLGEVPPGGEGLRVLLETELGLAEQERRRSLMEEGGYAGQVAEERREDVEEWQIAERVAQLDALRRRRQELEASLDTRQEAKAALEEAFCLDKRDVENWRESRMAALSEGAARSLRALEDMKREVAQGDAVCKVEKGKMEQSVHCAMGKTDATSGDPSKLHQGAPKKSQKRGISNNCISLPHNQSCEVPEKSAVISQPEETVSQLHEARTSRTQLDMELRAMQESREREELVLRSEIATVMDTVRLSGELRQQVVEARIDTDEMRCLLTEEHAMSK